MMPNHRRRKTPFTNRKERMVFDGAARPLLNEFIPPLLARDRVLEEIMFVEADPLKTSGMAIGWLETLSKLNMHPEQAKLMADKKSAKRMEQILVGQGRPSGGFRMPRLARMPSTPRMPRW